ncbi:MAG: chemotaxis protein CheB [Acidobacteria bacterium]|nr:chemotaxis protein CheB [Acidobacteriota bacterium]
MSPVRVLIVDDSATVRAALKTLLGRQSSIEVVGEAGEGRSAIAQVLRLSPDVVLMDLEMPGMDGLSAMEHIRSQRPTPIVVVTSRTRRDEVATAFAAVKRGAVAVFPKPEVPSAWENLASSLIATLNGLVPRRPDLAPTSQTDTPPPVRRPFRYLVVGASTGGPAAVHSLLRALGTGTGLGVAVVQHISAGFEHGLAEWLARELAMDIAVARNGEPLRPETVRLAPSGAHLILQEGGTLLVDREAPPRNGHRPSVDELLLSAARSVPLRTAGALLTGMGTDGVEGLATLRRAGGLTLTQNAESCAVFGMPRAAIELGAAELVLPPDRIGSYLRCTVLGNST